MNCHSQCHCSCTGMSHGLHEARFGWSRREFLYGIGALTACGLAAGGVRAEVSGQADAVPRGPLVRPKLRIQPVLTYEIPERRVATSWRNWGGIQTEADVAREKENIGQELARISGQADFPMEMRPLAGIRTAQQAGELAKGDHDVLLLYAAGGGVNVLEALTAPSKWNLMFLRHNPGPVYLWYEIAHPRFLRKTVDEYGQPGWDVQDVVVDDPNAILLRLRALSGLKATLQKKIVAIGGASGWGRGGRTAPVRTKDLWKMELIDYPYSDLSRRIKEARGKSPLVEECATKAGKYLGQDGVTLQTTRAFMDNAFILTEVFKDIMQEAQTDAITINSCMGTIMPMSETTACLPLSLLNDEGYLAFCESDFVVIPSGILLHYIASKPVFLNDPTYPHDSIVTLAHCTAPRKMDGSQSEPAKILTHFESDYGAAPKVEMKIGQVCTNLVPDFASKKWVGFAGTIVGNPSLDICRTQIDVRIQGDADALLEDMKGFHWMTSYGDHLQEVAYALRKIGVEFENVSAKKTL